MVKGGLRCIGSTQHLKNLYGAGYTLEMKIGQHNQKPCLFSTESSGGASAEAAIALVAQLFPAATLEESFAERLVFSVPQCSVSSLARCFQQIEDAKEKLNIVEYSFSQTTLEQVFLKFAQTENVESSDQEH
ncbi:jg27177 [Pararge aegeria aegeria]|uniref:Jg27177 protein n=1 Tax=Pararge aegeria aegeria TaxID=348720 RepID=A0A8S4SK56_9NEOP|nr:jg27177 [Pararge aegeria aegeria]